MSVTVDIVPLFNPPVAHNTICFMTSAVNAAFAVSYFFLKQLSPNSGHYYRLNKLSRHNPHHPQPSTEQKQNLPMLERGGRSCQWHPAALQLPHSNIKQEHSECGCSSPTTPPACLTFKMLFSKYMKRKFIPPRPTSLTCNSMSELLCPV